MAAKESGDNRSPGKERSTISLQPSKPIPQPTSETQPYWDGCKNHELRVQKCTACGHRQLYPRIYCTACMSEEVEWVKASGRGTVLSFTTVYRPVTKAFADEVPYVVALITLDEGPQIMSNIVGCSPQQIEIGRTVEVTFEDWTEEISVPKFTLVE